MAFNLTAAVGIAAGSIGLIADALIPKPAQRFAMAMKTNNKDEYTVQKIFHMDSLKHSVHNNPDQRALAADAYHVYL